MPNSEACFFLKKNILETTKQKKMRKLGKSLPVTEQHLLLKLIKFLWSNAERVDHRFGWVEAGVVHAAY